MSGGLFFFFRSTCLTVSYRAVYVNTAGARALAHATTFIPIRFRPRVPLVFNNVTAVLFVSYVLAQYAFG